MDPPPVPTWKLKLLAKKNERAALAGVTTPAEGGAGAATAIGFIAPRHAAASARPASPLRTATASDWRIDGCGWRASAQSRSRAPDWPAPAEGAERGGGGGGAGAVSTGPAGRGSPRRTERRVVREGSDAGPSDVVSRTETVVRWSGETATAAQTQYRADSSDTWRNTELKMGVSVTNGVMAGTGRRGAYKSPYRIGRGGISTEKLRSVEGQHDDSSSDASSEEFRYGPGIVSRLKNRYITIAMRESTGKRPSLRRVTSLEDLLDKDSSLSNGQKHDNQLLNARAAGRPRMESMKRAKSVGDLVSVRSAPPERGSVVGRGGRKDVPPIATEKVVLVEQGGRRMPGSALPGKRTLQRNRASSVSSNNNDKPMDHSSGKEEPNSVAPEVDEAPRRSEALPAPDTVRTVKRIFEPSPRRPVSSRATSDTKASSIRRTTPPPERPPKVYHQPESGVGRRTSPVVRPLSVPSRPLTTKPALPTSPKPRSPVVKPFNAPPVTSFSSLPTGPVPLSAGRRSLTASSLPSVAHSRAERSWGGPRQQTESADTTDRDTSRLNHSRSSPSRSVGKKPLSRESSLDSTTAVRRQVGVIKPTRKAEPRDEFSRRKNALNHVRNSVVEKEIAVIGTEYLKRKEEEAPRDITNKSTAGPTEAVSPVVSAQEEIDVPAPALPPRKALVVEPEQQPLTIDTAPPPRPAPFRGVVLKPVPKSEFTRPTSRDGRPVSPPPPPPVAASAFRTPATSSISQSGDLENPSAESSIIPVLTPSVARAPATSSPIKSHAVVPSAPTKTQSAISSAPANSECDAPVKSQSSTPPGSGKPQPAGGKSEPQPAVSALASWSAQQAANKQKWHQTPDTSMVFNFTKRQDVPDYVEDDGIIMRRKLPKAGDSGYVILPGFDPGQSCDDDYTSSLVSGPPSPCNVTFVNADVVINGKSSLMKKPKPRKMAVSFATFGPLRHEYPSETSLTDLAATYDTSATTDASAPGGTLGGFASYTPHKMAAAVEFELGVSRLSAPAPAPAPPPPERLSPDEFLKPADQSETVAWSCDTSSDMLF